MNFSKSRRRRGTAEINLTPLIDIVFNLLIFFLITSTFAQNPGIEVDLPKASTAPEAFQKESVTIAVTQLGEAIVSGKIVNFDELETILKEQHKAQSSATVIIQADEKTPHGAVVQVMDVARKAGFESLAIATEGE